MATVKFYSLAVDHQFLRFHLNGIKMGMKQQVTLAAVLILICECAHINKSWLLCVFVWQVMGDRLETALL